MRASYTVGQPWNPERRLITINEAALTIDRPASTIRRWASEGRIPCIVIVNRKHYYRELDILRVDAATHRTRRAS